MHTRSQGGFTLVELMISITIFLILLSMLIVIFRATEEGFSRASAMKNVFATSRAIIERMHDEIRMVFLDEQGRTAIVGVDAAAHMKTNSAEDEFYFCVPGKSLNAGTVAEIGYWQRSDGNLMRHYDGDADFDYATQDADDELGLIVEDFSVRYFNGTTYQDVWDSRAGAAEEGRAPKAVRISFVVSDDKRTMMRKFESVVDISAGERY